jgi:excisionase family DNA binding protein
MSSECDLTKGSQLVEEDCLLTAAEAARLMNFKNVGTVYHLVNQNRIPVVKLSARCIRFSRKALLEWIESMTHPAESHDFQGQVSVSKSEVASVKNKRSYK